MSKVETPAERLLRRVAVWVVVVGALCIVAAVVCAVIACWTHGDTPVRLCGTAAIAFLVGVVLAGGGFLVASDE